jgi:parvulin-like peptidyl-prolyl isomerase
MIWAQRVSGAPRRMKKISLKELHESPGYARFSEQRHGRLQWLSCGIIDGLAHFSDRKPVSFDVRSARRLAASVVIVTVVCAATGCGVGQSLRAVLHGEKPDPVAVQVGAGVYTKAELDRFFDSRLSEFRDPGEADKVKSNLLDSFIDEKLLLERAAELKVKANPQAVKAMLDKIAEPSLDERQAGQSAESGRDAELERSVTENFQIQQYLHEHLLKDVAVTEQECEAYFKQHLSDYVRKDVVRLREILLDDAAEAQKIQVLLALKRNKNFSELARVYSKANSAAEGGDLGTFQRGELPEEFEKVVFALSPGTASKIVRTKYGYHLFLVEEKILAHQLKFWEVKDEINEKLLGEREREIINRELESLMKQIRVEIHRDKLDFKYIGTRFGSR